MPRFLYPKQTSIAFCNDSVTGGRNKIQKEKNGMCIKNEGRRT